MREEERLLQGLLFWPLDPELRAMKAKAHKLSALYSRTFEEETETRSDILRRLLGGMGNGVFMQGPIFFHYGCHTTIGDNFYANYNLTVQDDARVEIGSHCAFGPNVTIVTPNHPLIASERLAMLHPDGQAHNLCYAQPVKIGDHVWLGGNVTICGGVTIGDGCVIGAGSVVTRDIPAHTVAAGVPCRVIREITEADSMQNRPELLGGCSVLP